MRFVHLVVALAVALSSFGLGAAPAFAHDKEEGKAKREKHEKEREPRFGKLGVNGEVTAVSCNTQFTIEARNHREATLHIVEHVTLFRFAGGDTATCQDMSVGMKVHALAWRSNDQVTALIVQLPRSRPRFEHLIGVITEVDDGEIEINDRFEGSMAHNPTVLPTGYTPTVGDRVLVLAQGQKGTMPVVLLIVKLGGLAPPPPTSGTTVTISASDANAAEAGLEPGGFTVTRSGGDTTAALTVNYTVGGTATSGTDYTALSSSVTIPAGSSTATLAVSPIDDSTDEPDETVVVTLASGTGYTVGSSNQATVTIADNDPTPAPTTTVSISASDANAAEAGLEAGGFTVTRSGGDTTAALTVNYTVSGTATAGSDYTALSGLVVMPASATSVGITVTPVDDSTDEPDETVIVALASGTGYTVGSANQATVTIADNDPTPAPTTTVTISASDANAAEAGLEPGGLTVTRSGGDTTAALTVNYTVGGTATAGSDYTALSGLVVMPASATSVGITVTPVDDSTDEPDETVIVALASGTGYTVGSANQATVTIADNDPTPAPATTVSISASDANAAEAGLEPGGFSVTRSGGDTTAALTVNYTVGGTATAGTDYTALSSSVTIAAGSSTATIVVTPVDDNIDDDNETVVVTLATGAGYTVGSASQATVTIADNDPT